MVATSGEPSVRRERLRRWCRRGFLMLLVCLGAACSRPLEPKPVKQDPRLNVILIVVDALRADHLGCYGYSANTTPVIDALAKNALVGTRVYSQSNWTGAAMASMMTGTYPAVHKIAKSPDDGLDRFSVLPKTLRIIPEVLRDRGYYTAAVTSCGWVSPVSGYGKGFADFQLVGRNDEVIVGKAIEILRTHPSPFFLYLHLLDTHDYFDLHKDYRPFSGRRFTLSKTMEALAQKPRGDIFGWLGTPQKKDKLTSEDVAYLVDRYDSFLNRADRLVGELVGFLREQKTLDNTLVILSADHGENFSEHEKFVHNGDSVYNETLHVPLIISNPVLFPEQKRVERLAEELDIFPTILGLLGIKDAALAQTRQLQGDSLLAAVEDKAVWSENGSQDRMKILVENWSLIVNRSTGQAALYDLSTDPRETRNLARSNPQVVGRLEQLLLRKIRESTALGWKIVPQDAPIDLDTKKVLESLGYLR